MSNSVFIVTCEHASAFIPVFYERFVQIKDKESEHWIFDKGAVECASSLAWVLKAKLHKGEVSRKVIDLNRSISSRSIFRHSASDLPDERKLRAMYDYYLPYRIGVYDEIKKAGQKKKKIHFSVHTFVPAIGGKERNADVGLLYDPSRKDEKRLAEQLAGKIDSLGFRVRMNYPYKGCADGFTTALRKQFGQDEYIGIEIELNQRNDTAVLKGLMVDLGYFIKKLDEKEKI